MEITDSTANVLGILYTTQKMIHNITANSGSLAQYNEYQVHYNTTNFRLLDDDNFFIDISVPSVIFNYPQKVSGAAISFEMTDVIDMSTKTAPITDAKHKEIMSKFYNPLLAFAKTNNFKLTVSKEQFNNIHRHPSSLSSFSGTDYDTNPENPGICFPLSKGHNTPIFSSIILHGTQSYLAHTEYRVADTINDDLVYYKGDCHTYCKGYTLNLPTIYKFFTDKPTTIASTFFPQPTLAVRQIYDLFDSIQYEPDTQLVQASNLETKSTAYSYYSSSLSKFDKLPTTVVDRDVTPHVGTFPKFTTFLSNQEKYANKLFTTIYGTFLGADILDAWDDLQGDSVTSDVTLNNLTVKDFINNLEAMDMLDLYLLPYTPRNTKYESLFDDLIA